MRKLRILQSSMRRCWYSRSLNQRDFHSVVIPSRNPYGLTFWPIALALFLGCVGLGFGLYRPNPRPTHPRKRARAMGQKVNPYGFRLGITTEWKSRWFNEREYQHLLIEDWRIRNFLMTHLHRAAVRRV